jgi:hypothetical protein
MQIITGKVVSGKIIVEGTLPEGATVTVLAPDGDVFTLTPDEESALLAAISEADRGEVVDAESFHWMAPPPHIGRRATNAKPHRVRRFHLSRVQDHRYY